MAIIRSWLGLFAMFAPIVFIGCLMALWVYNCIVGRWR